MLLTCSSSAVMSQVLMPCQFTGCSFGSAAVWQYESLKSRVQSYFDEIQADWLEKLRPQKRGDVRKEVRRVGSRVTSEGPHLDTGDVTDAQVSVVWPGFIFLLTVCALIGRFRSTNGGTA